MKHRNPYFLNNGELVILPVIAVAAAVAGLRDADLAACLKHWPGHGGTGADSHLGPAAIGEGRLAEPFAAGVRAGADACERVGDGLVAAHIIARPHREVEPILPEKPSVEGDGRYGRS